MKAYSLGAARSLMFQRLRDLLRSTSAPPTSLDDAPAVARGTPEDPQDPDLSWLDPPRDIHDVPAWDRYWRNQVTHGLRPAAFDLFADDQHLLDEMRRRDLRTVLCVATGISLEPRALAYAGMPVMALDSSSVAIELAQTFVADEQYFQRFFECPAARPGGTVEFSVGDFMNADTCSGPFDVVIERRTIQLFSDIERLRALATLAGRLAPTGIFVSHFHHGWWKPGEPLNHPAESWFVKKRFTILSNGGRQEFPGIGDSRTAWLQTTTG
jgi:SAM-dependent methyltransferase